jgi:hypothetical protein
MRTATRCCLLTLLLLALERTSPAQHLDYFGGPVVSTPRYYQVLWGTGSYQSNISSTATPSIATFLGQTSAMFSWFDGEYNTVAPTGTKTNQHLLGGTFGGQYTITPSTSSATIDDSTIQSELTAQIGAGHLPAPQQDSGGYGITIYVVFFPPGKTITQGGSNSCQAGGFCAYHGTIQPASGAHYFYAVMPDMQSGSGCDTGCGTGSVFGNYTSVLSHEIAETITDADVGLATTNGPPLAWYDNTNGEIGDICNASQTSFAGSDGQTYILQTLWSNAQSKCVGPHAPASDFSVSANPAALTIKSGQTTTVTSTTVSTQVVSGNPESITLSVTGVPSGVGAAFNPTSVTTGGSSVLSFTTPPNILLPQGPYHVTVTGTPTTGASGFTPGAAQTSDFAIAVGPSPMTLTKGSGVSLAVTTAAIYGAQPVSLAVSGLPDGVTASFSPASIASGQAATLYLIAAHSASMGTVTVTVTGTAGSGSHSAAFPLTIVPPGAAGSGITNGGFETGDLTGWISAGTGAAVRSNPYSGRYAALAGNAAPTNGDSSLSQTFIAPPSSSQVSFWYDVHCQSVGYDWATATLRDNTLGVTATILPKTCANTGWTNLSVQVTGDHSYTLTLTNHDDGYPGDAAFTFFDGVAFDLPGAGAGPVWKQIGAPDPGDSAPPPPAKGRYRGVAFQNPIALSPALSGGVNGAAGVHSVTVTLDVVGPTPSLGISNIPANAVYGGTFTLAFAYTGDGTTSVTSGTTGTCTVSAGVVSFVGVGACTLTAHATAGTYYAAVDGSPQSFAVGQATPTISIGNLPANAAYGGSFTPAYAYTGDGTTSATSGTPSTCAVSGGAVNFVGVGTCTLTAHAAAGVHYTAADGTVQSFTIGQATPAVSITNVPAAAVYGGTFTPAVANTGDGSTSVTSGTPSTCTVSAGVVNFVGTGTCTLAAHAAAGTNYKAADGTPQSFTIGQAAAAVSIGNVPASAVYGGTFTPSFIYSGDGATTATSGTPGTCTVSAGVVSFVGVGTCTLTAHASAGVNYKAADGTPQPFTIGQATPTIGIANLPANAVYGGSFIPALAYTGDGATSVTSGTPSTCAVSGGVVSFVAVGTCTLAAHASAGTTIRLWTECRSPLRSGRLRRP